MQELRLRDLGTAAQDMFAYVQPHAVWAVWVERTVRLGAKERYMGVSGKQRRGDVARSEIDRMIWVWWKVASARSER
jgi:hypothetical protein